MIAGVDTVPADPYLGVVTGFQPAGRAPAPAPLDLLQDFVNTEIPEWAQDDLATPAALSAWLAERGLLDPRDGPASADAFLRARSLRSCLRSLALANTTGIPPGADATAGVAELGLSGLRSRSGTTAPPRSRRPGRASTGRSRCSRRSPSPRRRQARGRGSRPAARTAAAGSSTTSPATAPPTGAR